MAGDPPPEPGRGPAASRRRALGVAIALSLFAAYFLAVPLLWPRGPYGHGVYRLKDVYLGVPVGLAALGAVVVAISSTPARRERGLGMTMLWIAVVATTLFFDASCAAFRMAREVEISDPELAWIRRPNFSWTGPFNRHTRDFSFQADENGFRNPAGLREAELAFIGDSFTEGAGVPDADTFVRRVARATGGLRAVNLGRSGYSPPQEVIVLRRYALGYRPRVVVWQLFEGNDITDAEHFERWREGKRGPERPLVVRYVNESPLCRWLALTLEAPQALLRGASGTARPFLLTDRYVPDLPARHPLGTALVRSALAEAARLARENGFRLLVVSVPLSVRVLAPDLSFESSAQQAEYLPSVPGPARSDFTAVVGAACSELGVPFVDLFPALEERARRDNRHLYFSGDMHFDVEGHGVAAEQITAWLKAL